MQTTSPPTKTTSAIARRLGAPALVLGIAALAAASSPSPEAEPSAMVSAANAVLEELGSEGRALAQTGFDDKERRTWAFGPVTREGIRADVLSEDDSKRVRALLDTVLSESGLAAVDQVRHLESVLHRRESKPDRPAAHRDPELYWLRIYGTVSDDTAWAWRYEGHHFALHVTCVPGRAPTVTPFFLGASPVFGITEKEWGTGEPAPDGASLDAFTTLNGTLQEIAKAASDAGALRPASKRPRDIRMGPGGDELPAAEGPLIDELGPQARENVVALLDQTMQLLDPEFRRYKVDGATRFALWGGVDLEAERAWHVRTETFLLEFATTTGADHVHLVLRDIGRDFGGADAAGSGAQQEGK